jgi:hypothetical protein
MTISGCRRSFIPVLPGSTSTLCEAPLKKAFPWFLPLKRTGGYDLFFDRHRILVLHYKFAMLYFGSGDYHRSIDYLQMIIHDKTNLRYDLQCYARVVHLMAHYELGNDMLMESLTKSVYRFMAKMKNFTTMEEAIFSFLRHPFHFLPGN